jgi:hypothetical protein
MEFIKLEGGEGETYGGGNGFVKDLISHAAWTHEFFTGPQIRERLSALVALLTVDNLIGMAVLRQDPAIGQCVSYYRITLDFRQDQGGSHFIFI